MNSDTNIPRDVREIPRDIRQVKVPMRLDVWNPQLIDGVTAVHEVYVTDLSVAHHICSFERNAWCLGIRTEFTFADGLSEERIEELQEIETSNPPQDDYFLMSRIAKLPFVRFEDDTEDTDEEAMEAAREDFQCNWREPPRTTP